MVTNRARKLASTFGIKVATTVENSPFPISIVTAGIVDGVRSHAWVNHLGSNVNAADIMSSDDLKTALQRAGIGGFHPGTADEAQLRGWVSALRGAEGEVAVERDFLDHKLPMPSGTFQVQQLDFTNPGSDYNFLDSRGHILGSANLKIAQSDNVIIEHFRNHPDVNLVYTTSDAAQDAAHHGYQVIGIHDQIPAIHGPLVVDIGKSSHTFTDPILNDLHNGTHEGLLHSRLHQLPWISGTIIGWRAYQRYKKGVELGENLRQSGQDATVSAGVLAVGGVFHHFVFPEPTIVLASLLTAVLIRSVQGVREHWDLFSTYESEFATRVSKLASSRVNSNYLVNI
jgi:hypothetical protein